MPPGTIRRYQTGSGDGRLCPERPAAGEVPMRSPWLAVVALAALAALAVPSPAAAAETREATISLTRDQVLVLLGAIRDKERTVALTLTEGQVQTH